MICLFGPVPDVTLRIGLRVNPFVCDCMDFEIYTLVGTTTHVATLDDLYCNSPVELYNKRVRNSQIFLCLRNLLHFGCLNQRNQAITPLQFD